VNTYKPFDPAVWSIDESNAPYSRMDVVRSVAYEADRGLLRLMGHYEHSAKAWRDLSNEQRGKWINEGPQKNKRRALLYHAVMFALKDLYDGSQV
jgi:Zn-dependent protease with chaperone function